MFSEQAGEICDRRDRKMGKENIYKETTGKEI
jgi:hypothetical protein